METFVHQYSYFKNRALLNRPPVWMSKEWGYMHVPICISDNPAKTFEYTVNYTS